MAHARGQKCGYTEGRWYQLFKVRVTKLLFKVLWDYTFFFFYNHFRMNQPNYTSSMTGELLRTSMTVSLFLSLILWRTLAWSLGQPHHCASEEISGKAAQQTNNDLCLSSWFSQWLLTLAILSYLNLAIHQSLHLLSFWFPVSDTSHFCYNDIMVYFNHCNHLTALFHESLYSLGQITTSGFDPVLMNLSVAENIKSRRLTWS